MARQAKSTVPERSHRAERPAPAPPEGGLWPSFRALADPRGPFLIPLLLLAFSRAVYAWRIPLAAEDAYITFRYARNLVAGHGLVFNPGERVMGFTSPLWTLWIALGIRVGGDPMIWARISAVFADAVTLLLVTSMLARSVSKVPALIFGVFFAMWPYFSAVAVSGMENGPMLALIVVAAALAERRSALAGPALAALALSRPEGLAAAAFLALGARPRDRLIAALIALAGLTALYLYYGTVLPQSVIAKARIYGTPGPWAGRHWWDWFIPMPLGRAPAAMEGVHLFVFSVVLSPAVVVGARELWARRGTALARIAAVGLLVWASYSLLGVAYFYWYLVIPLAAHVIAGSVGLPKLVRGRGIYVSASLFVVGMWIMAQTLYIGRAQNEYFSFGQVAGYLGQHARVGQKVLLEPIGMVGYFTDLRVVDEVGLVSPQVARRRTGEPGWYTDVVRAERPDWLVVRSLVIRKGQIFAGAGGPFRSPEEREALLAGYKPATSFGDGDQAIEVLERLP